MNIFLENLKEYYFLHRNKINMYVVFIIICIVFLIIFYSISIFNNKKDNKKITYEENIVTEKKEDANEYIYVDIKGSVNKEGVYKVINGTRVFDLIETAGGLKKDANTRFINLSKILNDGEVVVIYSNGEIEEAKKSDIIYVETPCVCEKVKNDACLNENINNNDSDSLININNATKEQLETLSGIGESKATAIIEYRNSNGKFNKIEDILNVSGISETLFDKIKAFITV
jgi:competence protein ComEA